MDPHRDERIAAMANAMMERERLTSARGQAALSQVERCCSEAVAILLDHGWTRESLSNVLCMVCRVFFIFVFVAFVIAA